jgi:hypothetical protein
MDGQRFAHLLRIQGAKSSDPRYLTASVSPGREVVDTAFGALHCWGRAEEVYPPTPGQTAPAEDAGSGESPLLRRPLNRSL